MLFTENERYYMHVYFSSYWLHLLDDIHDIFSLFFISMYMHSQFECVRFYIMRFSIEREYSHCRTQVYGILRLLFSIFAYIYYLNEKQLCRHFYDRLVHFIDLRLSESDIITKWLEQFWLVYVSSQIYKMHQIARKWQ